MTRSLPPVNRCFVPALELSDICRAEIKEYEDCKLFGAVFVYGNERVPATGVDSTVDVLEAVVIPRGSRNAIMLHIEEIEGVQSAREDLAYAAAYIAMHECLRTRLHVVGVTYGRLARLAMRAGFRPMKPYFPDEEYADRVRQKYQAQRLTDTGSEAGKLAMVYMPTNEFVNTFAPAEFVERLRVAAV